MTRLTARPPSNRGTRIPEATPRGSRPARQKGSAASAALVLDEVESVAQVGSYSLDILTARWTSSKGLDRIFGIDRAFVRSLEGWASLIHPADREALVAYLANDVLGRGGSFDAEYRIVRADSGEERWVHGRGTLTLDASGRPVVMLGTVADITSGKRAEASLNRMSELVERAAEVAKVGAWELDPATMELLWSPETYRIHDIDPAVVPGVELAFDFYSPEAQPVIRAAVRAAIDSGTPFDLELPTVTATGRPMWVRSQGSAKTEGGRTILVHGIIQDITERKQADQELRQSEARTRDLIEGSGDGILVSDVSGRYVEANPAICGMLGYTRDELLAMRAGDLTAADDPVGNEGMDGRLTEASGETGILVERRYRRHDGASLPVEVRFKVLPDGRQQRNVRDIGERARADEERAALVEELRRSEGSLAEAQRIAHIGSWEWDLVTGTAHRSEELHRIYGVEPGTIPPTAGAFYDFVHPDDRARVQAAERTAIAGGAAYAIEYRGVRADGGVRLIRDEAEVFRDVSGAPVRMIGTVQDITERVAADGERAQLAAAVEQTADAVWIKDNEASLITYVNRSFSRLYGYEPEEIVGRWAGILHSGRHEHPFFDAVTESVAQGDTWSGFIINRRKDGTLVEVDAVISGIRDASGKVVGYMQTDRDVTRERALESELARRSRERNLIEAALRRIDPGDTPESIAEVVCAELVRLPGVESAFVLALERDDHGLMLAVEGPGAAVFVSTRVIPAHRARHLLERATDGVWTETFHATPEDGVLGEQMSATGLRSVAYAPLHGPDGVIGVLGLGNRGDDRDAFAEQLPVLAAFASIVGSLLAPGLMERSREDEGRGIILEIIEKGAFVPFFQPIVRLHTGSVVGYEALSRFSNGMAPDVTFELASQRGLGPQLEAATLRAALEASVVLPPAAYVSLNASPAFILSGALRALLAGITRRVFIEITEHVAIRDYSALRTELAALGPTVGVSVDDAGAGFASLHHILELAPHLVKLDMSLVRGINADPARQALITGMGYFAAKRKLHLIAEGIETPKELEALLRLGIGYGQGYLLGRPTDGRSPGPWPTTIASVAARRRPRTPPPAGKGASS